MNNVKSRNTLPTYPVLSFAARHGRVLPAIFALLTFVLGVWLSFRTATIDFAVAGLIAAVAVQFLTKGALELVELVVELLIPG
jgi:hypothetical protein